MSETNPKFKVTIDGIEVEVDPGTTILNAARMIGGDVVPPAMCYYSSLEGSGGKCRTCLVEVSKGSEKILDRCLNWLQVVPPRSWMVWK